MALVAVALLAGCGRKTVVVPDSIVSSGGRTEAVAYVANCSLAVFTEAISKASVQFFVDDRCLGDRETDYAGRAIVELTELSGKCVKARAVVGNQPVEGSGYVFTWDRDRTAIAIDIDETISLTNYRNLIWGDGLRSEPMKGSAKAVRALARDYHIMYWSARPQFMVEPTRKWLKKNGFPEGPIVLALDYRAAFNQTEAKSKMLAELRRRWPNLLIVIGDKIADVESSAANGILPVIVNPQRPQFSQNAVVAPDWRTLREFFRHHGDLMRMPTVLAAAIQDGRLFGVPNAPPASPAPQTPTVELAAEPAAQPAAQVARVEIMHLVTPSEDAERATR